MLHAERPGGPVVAAQLRLLAELQSLLDYPKETPSMWLFVTDTLGNPYVEEEYIPQILLPLGESRRRANEIKRQEKIIVVIGNPTATAGDAGCPLRTK